MKILGWFLVAALVVSCQRNPTRVAPIPFLDEASVPEQKSLQTAPLPPLRLLLEDVSVNGCLNLARVTDRLQNAEFTYPASSMTTEFRIASEPPSVPEHSRFLAYSSFFYRTGLAKELLPFLKAQQLDCSSIQLMTASGTWLRYVITEFSVEHVSFELASKVEDSVVVNQKDAVFKRSQPVKYEVFFNSETQIRINLKTRLTDPLCFNNKGMDRKSIDKKNIDKKNGFDIETSETINWARTVDDLPQSYYIGKNFINLVLSSLVNPPFVEPDKALPLSVLNEIMVAPIQEDTKKCL